MENYPPPSGRPAGIVILAILFFLSGIVNLLSGVLMLTNAAAPELWEAVPMIMAVNLVTTLLGIFYILIGIGLFTLKRWARTVAIVLTLIGIITALALVGATMALASEVGGSAAAAIGTMALICASIPILINVIILVYLFSAKVKAAFGVM